nr:Putative DNA-binding protein [Kibdelosporangium sp. MJ126-NF4]CTQ89680.1 Putative DNA-binding protein [Kibdelosporangium sp. MJ126-NF4]
MLAQLDRLNTLSTLPNVRVGIISSRTQYVVGPWHGFWLRDDESVAVETYSAELRLAQPEEVALYGRVFEHLSSIASYDRAARAIITRLADDLAGELSSEDE